MFSGCHFFEDFTPKFEEPKHPKCVSDLPPSQGLNLDSNSWVSSKLDRKLRLGIHGKNAWLVPGSKKTSVFFTPKWQERPVQMKHKCENTPIMSYFRVSNDLLVKIPLYLKFNRYTQRDLFFRRLSLSLSLIC